MKNRRIGGFSIVELAIVFTVFIVIGIVVANLFHRGNSTYRHAESHLELQRTGRNIISRITPYVSSSFDGDLPIELPIVIPQVTEDAESPKLVFRSTEDWLSPDYPSPATSSLSVTTHEDIEGLAFLYQIRALAPDSESQNTRIVLEQLHYDESVFNLLDPVTYPVLNQRVLYRLKTGETLNSFVFRRPRATVVTLEFQVAQTVRSTSNLETPLTEDFRTTFNLPYTNL